MIALLLVLACSAERAPGECASHADCAAWAVCAEGRCEVFECTWRGDCGLDQHCSERTHTCEPGCQDDGDCLPGSSCVGGECMDPACQETWLDCLTGWRCGAAECEPEPGLCDPCDPGLSETCGAGWVCAVPGGSPLDEGYCLPLCAEEGEPCSAGLVCGQGGGGGGLCFAHCPTLLEQGWL